MKQNKLKDEKELTTVVKELWLLPEREFQYFAIELLAFYKKLWQSEIIKLFEYCITHKSWWDTVDFMATECTGKYFKMFPNRLYQSLVTRIHPPTFGFNAAVYFFKKVISVILIPVYFLPILLTCLLQKNFLYKKQ